MIQRSTCKGGTDRPMAAAPGTLTDYNGVSEALGRRRVRYVCRNVACQGLRRGAQAGLELQARSKAYLPGVS